MFWKKFFLPTPLWTKDHIRHFSNQPFLNRLIHFLNQPFSNQPPQTKKGPVLNQSFNSILLLLIQPNFLTTPPINPISFPFIQLIPTNLFHYFPNQLIRLILIQLFTTLHFGSNHLLHVSISSFLHINRLSNVANRFILR